MISKSIQPSSPGSREKMSWYSTKRAWAATWFLSDHLYRPDKSSCWRSNFFLWSTVILVHWIPCISSNFSRVLGVTSIRGTAFTATTWVTLTPLVIMIWVAIRFFTTITTCLLPEITLVYVFTTLKSWGKWVPSPPFRHWVITCILFPRSSVSVWLYIIFNKKASTSSFFVVLTTLFKSVGSTIWFGTVSLWIESPAHQQAHYWAILDPFRETNNLSISLSMITLMIWLMVGVPRVTGTQDPKPVDSSMTRTTWSLL